MKNFFLKKLHVQNWLYRHHLGLLAKVIYKYNRIVYSCDIPPSVKIGKNCLFPHHALGVVIHPKSIIGDNCRIYQNVTIGSKDTSGGGPKVGNNVFIGAGACVLGRIEIGDNVVIAANSVVLNSSECDVLLAGVPANVKKKII